MWNVWSKKSVKWFNSIQMSILSKHSRTIFFTSIFQIYCIPINYTTESLFYKLSSIWFIAKHHLRIYPCYNTRASHRKRISIIFYIEFMYRSSSWYIHPSVVLYTIESDCSIASCLLSWAGDGLMRSALLLDYILYYCWNVHC